jgi:hypothetical protein
MRSFKFDGRNIAHLRFSSTDGAHLFRRSADSFSLGILSHAVGVTEAIHCLAILYEIGMISHAEKAKLPDRLHGRSSFAQAVRMERAGMIFRVIRVTGPNVRITASDTVETV